MNLKRLRESRKLSQYALAKKAGVSREYVRNLEAGKYDPTLRMLEKLADVLTVSVTKLSGVRGKRMGSSGAVVFDPRLERDNELISPELVVWSALRAFRRKGATPVELTAELRETGLAEGSPEAVADRVARMLDRMVAWSAQRRVKKLDAGRYRAMLESER